MNEYLVGNYPDILNETGKEMKMPEHHYDKENLSMVVMTMSKTMASKGKMALFDTKKSINRL
jgi:hypothetical protein